MATVTARARNFERVQSPTKNQWEVNPWKHLLAVAVMIVAPIIFLAVVVGGIIFWMPHLPIAHARAVSDNQVAKDGLGTIKKMVGDNAAWSAAIKDEYDRIYGNNLACGAQTSNLSEAK